MQQTLDLAGPVQGVFFLVVKDTLSKWAEIEIMPLLQSLVVTDKLRSMFASYGLPELVVSDYGTAFSSQAMQSFLERNGVRCMYTATYHPASNTRTERMVRELKCALRTKV